jgi:predicted MFS family arabinose efflux permease
MSYGLMLAVRFIHGIFFALCSTVMSAIAADLVPEGRKGEGIGYFNMFLSLSAVVGPYMALVIADTYSFRILFIVCAVISFIALCCGLPLRLTGNNDQKPEGVSFDLAGLFDISTMPVAVSAALLALPYSGIMTFIGLYAESINLAAYAKYYFIIYGITVIFSRPIGGMLFDRYGRNMAVYPFLFIFITGLVVLSTASGPVSIILTGLLTGFGFGTLFSTLLTIALADTPKSRRGVASSTFFIFYDSCMGIGSTLLGIGAGIMGYRLMYAASILFVFISAVVFFMSGRKNHNAENL